MPLQARERDMGVIGRVISSTGAVEAAVLSQVVRLREGGAALNKRLGFGSIDVVRVLLGKGQARYRGSKSEPRGVWNPRTLKSNSD